MGEGPGITRGADCRAGARGSAEQPASVARLIASSTRVVNQQLAISPYVDSAYMEARAVHAKRGEAHEKTIYREVTSSRRAAAKGEPFEITKHGRPVGRLGAPDAVRDPRVVAEAVARPKSYRGAVKSLQTADVLALKHEGHHY